MGARTKRTLTALLCSALLACGMAATQVDALLDQAAPFDHSFRAREALVIYEKARKIEPDNIDVLLGIARQYRHLMADSSNKAQKLEYLDRALETARHAEKLAPRNAQTHLSIAITYGKRTPLEGSGDRVRTSKLLKSEIDKTLALDPDDDTAWHLLGRYHLTYAELSGVKRTMGELLYGELPDSTAEQAAKCFEKAASINPNRPMHYIELGRAYALMGRDADARRFIEKGLSMPNTDKDDPEIKAVGRETLNKL